MKPPRFLSVALSRLGMVRGPAREVEVRPEDATLTPEAPPPWAPGPFLSDSSLPSISLMEIESETLHPPPSPPDFKGKPPVSSSFPADAATLHADPAPSPMRSPREGFRSEAPPVPLARGASLPEEGWPLGPYQVLSLLGEGGMGNVWRGIHRSTGAEVALKVLHRADRREWLAREARAVARVDHPGVIRLYDYGDVSPEDARISMGILPQGALYLVMEVARSGSLEAHPPDTWLDIHRAIDRVLETLAAVHARGLVHRDLKPANILRMRPGMGRGSLKLADFGLAGAADDLGDLAGTPHYMAPEQMDPGVGATGPWTDLYAVGAIAWRWITGRTPFDGPSPESILIAHLRKPLPPLEPLPGIELPLGAPDLIRRLLSKSPGARFEFAADAREAWRHLLPTASPKDFPPVLRPVIARAEPPPLLAAGLRLFALREAPLTGRESTQEVLWDTLQGVYREGRARVVLLEGSPGVGKSRLAFWLAERAHEEGLARVITALHTPFPDAPDTGLIPALARHYGVHRLTGLPRARRLLGRLGGGEEHRERGARILALLDPSGESAAAGGLSRLSLEGSEARWRVLEEVLEEEGRDRPTVLLLDDLHWGQDAARFTEFLLQGQGLRTTPTLVVGTLRRGEPSAAVDALRKRPEVTLISIPPLASEQTQDLVRRTLAVEPILARRVAERSEGNPLFALRLLDAWVRESALEPGEGGLRLRPGYSEEALPQGIQEVWERKIRTTLHTLPEGAQAVLWHAAALGNGVRREELQAVLSVADGNLLACLDPTWEAALEAGLWRDSGPGAAAFDHGLLRETLLAQAGNQAPRIHRQCAAGLARHLDPAMPGTRGRIGRHLLAAEDWAFALDHLLAEARLRFFSLAIGEAETALAHAQIALRKGRLDQDPTRYASFLMVGSRIRRQAGRYREALQMAQAAWTLVEKGDHRLAGRAAHLAGLAAEGLRDLEQAQRLGETGLGHARAVSDAVLESDCLRLLGVVAGQRGELRDAMRLLQRAADIVARSGSRRDLLLCLNWLVVWGGVAGEIETVRKGVEMARTVASGSPDPGVRSLELRMEAVLARLQGDSVSALAYAGAARQAFAASGARVQELYCLDEMGEAARGMGDLQAAERWYREALSGWAALGDTRGEAISRINLALVHLAREELHAARAAAEAAERSFRIQGNRHYTAASVIVMAEIDAAEGNLLEAEARLSAASDLLGETGFVHEDLAEMLEDLGQRAAASDREGLAEKSLDLARGQWDLLGRPDRAQRVREPKGEEPASPT